MDRLTSRPAAKYWMRLYQNGQRNLTDEEQRFQRGKALAEKVLAMKIECGRSASDVVAEHAADQGISRSRAYREKAYALSLITI